MTQQPRPPQNVEDSGLGPATEKPRSVYKTVLTTVGALALFVAGAIASPALTDFYEWAKVQALGREITATEKRQLNVIDYDGSLREGYEVGEVAKGDCLAGSIFLGSNPNAYRCSYNSFVADPCLAIERGMAVVCFPAGPWKLELTRLELDTPVEFDPTQGGGMQEQPWALEIKDPRHAKVVWRCQPLTGATSPVAGNQPSWWCIRADGSGTGRGLNELVVDGPVWKLLFSDSEEAELVEAEVAVAWF